MTQPYPWPNPPPYGPVAGVLELGPRRYDLRYRALVMGILNRTPDSFFDRGATWAYDAFWRRADQVVAEGADIIDVGAVKAGPGPDVDEAEELDRLMPAVEGLVDRYDVPVSVDTWRAAVAAQAFSAGAVLGNDISGFADPGYLRVAAAAGASVVATHIRLAPRVADPGPIYGDLVGEISAFLVERAARAEAAGIPSQRVMVDAGLDLGKTADQSLELLRASAVLAGLGYPLLLSASNKTFLGRVLDLAVDERREASVAAHALGITLGCRVVRAHDVAGARRVRDMLAAIMVAGGGQE
jgi:dihydropteroate synthase